MKSVPYQKTPGLTTLTTFRAAFERRFSLRIWGSLVAETVYHEEHGHVYDAVRYHVNNWKPSPITLLAFTNRPRKEETFDVWIDPMIEPHEIRIDILWGPLAHPDHHAFRTYAKPVPLTPGSRTRYVWKYSLREAAFGIFIALPNACIFFYHEPSLPYSFENKAEAAARKQDSPEPPQVAPAAAQEPANPFSDRMARFISLQQHYKSEQEALRQKELPKDIMEKALDELERLYQNEVEKLSDDRRGESEAR